MRDIHDIIEEYGVTNAEELREALENEPEEVLDIATNAGFATDVLIDALVESEFPPEKKEKRIVFRPKPYWVDALTILLDQESGYNDPDENEQLRADIEEARAGVARFLSRRPITVTPALLGTELFTTLDPQEWYAVVENDDLTAEEVKKLLPFIDNSYNYLAVKGYGGDDELYAGTSKDEEDDVVDDEYVFQIWEGRL